MPYDQASFLAGLAVGRAMWRPPVREQEGYRFYPVILLDEDEELLMPDVGALVGELTPFGVLTLPYPVILIDDEADMIISTEQEYTGAITPIGILGIPYPVIFLDAQADLLITGGFAQQ